MPSASFIQQPMFDRVFYKGLQRKEGNGQIKELFVAVDLIADTVAETDLLYGKIVGDIIQFLLQRDRTSDIQKAVPHHFRKGIKYLFSRIIFFQRKKP